jgi:signal transduction histidine kinase
MRLRAYLTDLVIVAMFVAAELDVLVTAPDGPRVALLLFPALWTLPLLLRRRWPATAALAVVGALALEAQIAYSGTESQAALVAIVLAFYTLGRRLDRSRAVLACAFGVVLGMVVVDADKGPITGADVVFVAIAAGAPFGAGFALRRREEEAVELEHRATQAELEQEERADAAVAEERARIARELHDMIGHAISVITVQAGAARLQLDQDPRKAREPLVAIEETGHATMAEMRRLIGILREMGEPGLAPQPGMAQLERLVQGVRDAGLPVELHREGDELRRLPPAVDLAAYRIVQEALTNALKHGGDGGAVVTVRFAPGSLALEIQSPAGARANGAGNGHGLVGMRERVEGCGGELQAGATADGGYAVRAVLPLAGQPA